MATSKKSPAKVKLATNKAKISSTVASKAAKNTYAAVENTRSSAENVVKISSRAAKDFISSSADEAQKAQEKIFAFSQQSADKFAKSADAMTKALYETITASRENVDALVECSNVAAALAKEISSEAFEFANKNFSDSTEISKDFFACRTINDMMELQNRVVRAAMDTAFAQTNRISSLVFEYSSEALEPINERVAKTSEQFGKALSAA